MYLITLGQLELRTRPDGDLLLPAGKPLAVLTYLATSDRDGVSRDTLLDLLWANLPSDRGRHALRQTLHSIRRAVGHDPFAQHATVVRLNTSIASDRNDFVDAVRRSDFDAAISLYQGPFLGELALPGGLQFEQWGVGERARLHHLWHGIAEAAVAELLNAGDADGALRLAHELRGRDPEHESIWRLLITAHLHQGNSQAAITEAAALQHHLESAERQPQPATRELLNRLHNSATAATGTTQPVDPLGSPDLVGRATEFAHLLTAWQLAATGTVQAVHLVGEAGIGKSRLLDAVDERLTSLAGRTVTCHAIPGERRIPFGFLANCLDALAHQPGAAAVDPATAATLVQLIPTLRSMYPGVQTTADKIPSVHRLVAAAHDLLRNVALEAPIALLLDDLHWADAASLDVLSVAAARTEAVPLLIVTTSRHGSGLAAVTTREITVGPLTDSAIIDLLSAIGELPDDDISWLIELLHTTTHGSPLSILVALRTLLASSALALQQGSWQVSDRDRIAQLLKEGAPVSQQLRQLGGDASSVLRLLAIAGHPVSVAVLRAIAEMPTPIEAPLEALEVAGIARDTASGWVICHDRFAETALSTVADTEQARLHAELALALLDLDSSDRAGDLRHALRHAVDGRADELLPVIGRHWLALCKSSRLSGSPRVLLDQFARNAGADTQIRRLQRALPWYQRPGRVAWLSAAAAVTILAAAIGMRSGTSQHPLLAIDGDPTIDWNPLGRTSHFGFLTPIRVVARNADGTRDSAAHERVTARIVSGSAQLEGMTTVALSDGVAQFDSLWISPNDDTLPTIRLETSTGTVIAELPFRASEKNLQQARLHIVSASFAGTSLDPDHPVIRTPPDTDLTVNVVLRYRADWSAAAVMLCAVNSWQSGAAGVQTIGPLRTPIVNGRIERTIRFRSPDTPGRYHLILVARAESDCKWIASQTNWNWQVPSWNDGEDIADISEAELDSAQRTGMAVRSLLMRPDKTTSIYGLQSIEVVVE